MKNLIILIALSVILIAGCGKDNEEIQSSPGTSKINLKTVEPVDATLDHFGLCLASKSHDNRWGYEAEQLHKSGKLDFTRYNRVYEHRIEVIGYFDWKAYKDANPDDVVIQGTDDIGRYMWEIFSNKIDYNFFNFN